MPGIGIGVVGDNRPSVCKDRTPYAAQHRRNLVGESMLVLVSSAI